MAKEICISSTPHETRLAILEDDQLAEIYYERENEYTLAGSIYKGRVTRVLPGMQSAFVDVGLERDAFLYVTDFLEEQEEDSADFERSDATGGGRKRESSDNRGPREPQQRDQRPRSAESSVEPELQASEAAPRSQDRAPRSTEGRSAEGDADGRRWQGGRRGRRMRGGRGGSRDERPRDDRPRDDRPRDDRPRDDRPRSERTLESPEIVAEAISAEPVILPERGAPGGIASHNLPIVLPGESLSKYGRRPEASPSPVASSAPSAAPTTPARPIPGASFAKPSTQVEVPTGWDGGATLPGETLSRHRRSDSRQSESRSTWTPEPTAAAEPVAGAVPEAVAAVETPEPPVQTETAWSAEPFESKEPAPVVEKAYAAPVETVLEPEPAPVAEAAAHHTEPVEAASHELVHEEEVHEYEPEEASATHRVETPRSELRFSPPL